MDWNYYVNCVGIESQTTYIIWWHANQFSGFIHIYIFLIKKIDVLMYVYI